MSSISGVRQASPTQQVSSMRSKFNQSQNKQGVVSSAGAKGLDFVKRTALRPLGNKNNSTSIKEQMGSLNKQAKQIEQGTASPETKRSFQKQMQGTGTNVQKFDKANKVGGNMAKTAVTAGAVSAATAAAPVTGGASLALGAGVGAASRVGSGFLDKNTENKKTTLNPFSQSNRYNKKDAIGDGVSGGLSGAAGVAGKPLANAIGGPMKGALGNTAGSLVKKQVTSGVTEGASSFGGTVATEGAKKGKVDRSVLQEGAQSAKTGAVGGALGGTVSRGIKGAVGPEASTVVRDVAMDTTSAGTQDKLADKMQK